MNIGVTHSVIVMSFIMVFENRDELVGSVAVH